MHFEFLSRLNGVVFCVWICLEQVLILTMTPKHKLYWSVLLDSLFFWKQGIHIKSLQRMLGQFYNQNLIQESRQEMNLI